jgi:hypothetical protein
VPHGRLHDPLALLDTPWCHGDIIEVVTGARDAIDTPYPKREFPSPKRE